MDRNYSYFAYKPDVDWTAARDEFHERIADCGSREEFLFELTGLLARLEDVHIWIKAGEETLPTFQNGWIRNWNSGAIDRALEKPKSIGRFAVVGRTWDDRFGYVAINGLSARPAEVQVNVLTELERVAAMHPVSWSTCGPVPAAANSSPVRLRRFSAKKKRFTPGTNSGTVRDMTTLLRTPCGDSPPQTNLIRSRSSASSAIAR